MSEGRRAAAALVAAELADGAVQPPEPDADVRPSRPARLPSCRRRRVPSQRWAGHRLRPRHAGGDADHHRSTLRAAADGPGGGDPRRGRLAGRGQQLRSGAAPRLGAQHRGGPPRGRAAAGRRTPVEAIELDERQRHEVWPLLTSYWPPFDDYVDRAGASGRDIRVFRLRPVGPGAPVRRWRRRPRRPLRVPTRRRGEPLRPRATIERRSSATTSSLASTSTTASSSERARSPTRSTSSPICTASWAAATIGSGSSRRDGRQVMAVGVPDGVRRLHQPTEHAAGARACVDVVPDPVLEELFDASCASGRSSRWTRSSSWPARLTSRIVNSATIRPFISRRSTVGVSVEPGRRPAAAQPAGRRAHQRRQQEAAGGPQVGLRLCRGEATVEPRLQHPVPRLQQQPERGALILVGIVEAGRVEQELGDALVDHHDVGDHRRVGGVDALDHRHGELGPPDEGAGRLDEHVRDGVATETSGPGAASQAAQPHDLVGHDPDEQVRLRGEVAVQGGDGDVRLAARPPAS
jgi:hypothetical protein